MTMCFAVAGYALLLLTGVPWIIYTALFVIGLSAASVFAIAFSLAMQHDPAKANEISALMITGVAGGALVPPVMGVIADILTSWSALLVPVRLPGLYSGCGCLDIEEIRKHRESVAHPFSGCGPA